MHYIQMTCKIKEFLPYETEGLTEKELYALAQERKAEMEASIKKELGYEVIITQATLYKGKGENQ